MEHMELDQVMAALSPGQQANLGGIIEAAGSCYHCVNNTVTAMQNACEWLKRASLLWHLSENHPEDPNQAAKMLRCETDRNYILRIDDSFYTAQMVGVCNQCKARIIDATKLWTETKRIWEEFDDLDLSFCEITST